MRDPILLAGPFVMCLFAFLIVRVALRHSRQTKAAQGQLKLHSQLIEKFGTAPELLNYLQSDAGRTFLTPQPIEKSSAYGRILAAIQGGIVLTFVGAAFLLLRLAVSSDANEFVLVVGGILLALGLGFLASALAAFWLSRSWKLINGHHAADGENL